MKIKTFMLVASSILTIIAKDIKDLETRSSSAISRRDWVTLASLTGEWVEAYRANPGREIQRNVESVAWIAMAIANNAKGSESAKRSCGEVCRQLYQLYEFIYDNQGKDKDYLHKLSCFRDAAVMLYEDDKLQVKLVDMNIASIEDNLRKTRNNSSEILSEGEPLSLFCATLDAGYLYQCLTPSFFTRHEHKGKYAVRLIGEVQQEYVKRGLAKENVPGFSNMRREYLEGHRQTVLRNAMEELKTFMQTKKPAITGKQ